MFKSCLKIKQKLNDLFKLFQNQTKINQMIIWFQTDIKQILTNFKQKLHKYEAKMKQLV